MARSSCIRLPSFLSGLAWPGGFVRVSVRPFLDTRIPAYAAAGCIRLAGAAAGGAFCSHRSARRGSLRRAWWVRQTVLFQLQPADRPTDRPTDLSIRSTSRPTERALAWKGLFLLLSRPFECFNKFCCFHCCVFAAAPRGSTGLGDDLRRWAAWSAGGGTGRGWTGLGRAGRAGALSARVTQCFSTA
jgi:hypothetical protein